MHLSSSPALAPDHCVYTLPINAPLIRQHPPSSPPPHQGPPGTGKTRTILNLLSVVMHCANKGALQLQAAADSGSRSQALSPEERARLWAKQAPWVAGNVDGRWEGGRGRGELDGRWKRGRCSLARSLT